MRNNRRCCPTIGLIVFLNCLFAAPAFASFGFGGDGLGKSGLDFNRGYDVNTVTTVTGRVESSPRTDEKGQVFVDVRSGGETISLSLGPKSFWERKGIPLRPNDAVAARGSRAQGNDGKTYLMVQKITNGSAGTQAEVRGMRGEASWSNENGMRGGGTMRGGMMWGGGMMRGGGGGMMRR